jgi:hypothetical protein
LVQGFVFLSGRKRDCETLCAPIPALKSNDFAAIAIFACCDLHGIQFAIAACNALQSFNQEILKDVLNLA